MAEATTPEQSPSRQATMITAAQKQALIDNLQLEITERARKLRAQYALHAQGLRSRLEMRINRIPQPLRTTNILDLINKYAEQSDAPKAAILPASKPVSVAAIRQASPTRQTQQTAALPPRSRGVKRPSNEMSDKENVEVHEDLPLPKKRTKTAAAGAGPSSSSAAAASRGVSRKVDPSKVLSPKSHNSRTLPRSPIKAAPPSSPQKSYLARPVSPLKPGSSVSAATAALAGLVESKSARGAGTGGGSSSGGSRPGTAASSASSTTTTTAASVASSLRGKRGAAATGARAAEMRPPPVPAKAKATRARTASSSSAASNTSSGTTVITKKAAAGSRAGAAAAAARKGIKDKVAGVAAAATGVRKGNGAAAAAKKSAAAAAPSASTAGGRSLRSRK